MLATTFIISSDKYAAHLTGEGHPESPQRFWAIKRKLQQDGLMGPENTLEPRLATKKEVLSCHSEELFDVVERSAKSLKGPGALFSPDVIICPESFEIALLAAGGAMVGVDAVMQGRSKNAFCLLRPPGHHACKDLSMGFCIFNNVAIAARYAQSVYGIKRVAIIDWDVHHGNGTQDIFEADPSVFYFSTHAKGIYPLTGAASEKGCGNIMNVPVDAFQGDPWEIILGAFQKKLIPALDKFKPELILISAGFDAHRDDPLGGVNGQGRCNLDENCFAILTDLVLELAGKYCEGKVVSLLEGGYNLEALANSVAAHVRRMQFYSASSSS